MASKKFSASKIRDDIATSHREFLMAFHRPLQKVVLFIVGPLSTGLYFLGWQDNPSWQNLFLLFGVVGMFVCWFFAWMALRANRLEASVMTIVLAVIGFETIEMSLQSGSEATAVLGCFAVLAYATLYSKRYMILAAVASALGIVLSEAAKYFQFWDIQISTGLERVIMQSAFTLVLFPLIVIILIKRQNIQNSLFTQVQDSALSQGQIVETAGSIQPVINEVVGRIKSISNNFVAQAAEQAAATTEVATTVSRLRVTADQSATAAGSARHIAERTRHESMESRDRLGAIQDGFKDVLDTMDKSRVAISQLAQTADSVEEILNYNREIGEHIKVLAVNAAIEAARAGEYGKGFHVVASELREMIINTDENLEKSSALLDSIRAQAKDNAVVSSRSAEVLRSYYTELQSAGTQIESISESFVDTTTQVGLIAVAAKEQQSSISQVSTALAQIDTAAGQLEEAARILLEGVDDIVKSHAELNSVLTTGKV